MSLKGKEKEEEQPVEEKGKLLIIITFFTNSIKETLAMKCAKIKSGLLVNCWRLLETHAGNMQSLSFPIADLIIAICRRSAEDRNSIVQNLIENIKEKASDMYVFGVGCQ